MADSQKTMKNILLRQAILNRDINDYSAKKLIQVISITKKIRRWVDQVCALNVTVNIIRSIHESGFKRQNQHLKQVLPVVLHHIAGNHFGADIVR